jgi:ATP synthase protein I
MAQNNAPGSPGENKHDGTGGDSGEVGDLDDRRKALDAALAARTAAESAGLRDRRMDGGAGFAYALRLSSEFIAGVLVGAGIGYLIDRIVGTSPWGMIVFLLLGFVAGILNVLRSAGLLAEPETKIGPGAKPGDNKE